VRILVHWCIRGTYSKHNIINLLIPNSFMEHNKVISVSLPKPTIERLQYQSKEYGLSISSIVNTSLNKIEISFKK